MTAILCPELFLLPNYHTKGMPPLLGFKQILGRGNDFAGFFHKT